MGAPPGIGSASSSPTPNSGEQSNSTPPANGGTKALPQPSGPAAPPPKRDPTVPIQQPVQTPVTYNPDQTRLLLAKGIRLFSDNHLDSARTTLQPIAQEPLADALLESIEDRESRFRAVQGSLVLKSLAQDHAREKNYSEGELEKLRSAIGDIESQLLSKPSQPWSAAIEEAKKGFSADALKAWENFAKSQELHLKELGGLFQEKDREILAQGLLNLAERFRQEKYFGTSWTLAQLAAEFPTTEGKAKTLIDHLEGQRSSTEYVISDMFEQGGTSMAVNLLSLIPAVAGARRFSQIGAIATKPFLARVPLTLLAGGALHWGSTKALMGISGYDGQIMPRSFGEFGREFASSTAQVGMTLLLANRFWKIKPAASAEVAAENATASATGFRQRAISVLAKTPRALWWSTKTGLKIGTITGIDLATQWGFHATGVKEMTPRGFPQGLVNTFFPGTADSRKTVVSTYDARRLLEQHMKALGSADKVSSLPPVLDPNLNLDLFLTELDPSLDGDRREMAYAALAEAARQKKLGLNIRRWVLNKKSIGEFEAANKVLTRQGITLQLDQDGFVCFKDSKQFPCAQP